MTKQPRSFVPRSVIPISTQLNFEVLMMDAENITLQQTTRVINVLKA